MLLSRTHRVSLSNQSRKNTNTYNSSVVKRPFSTEAIILWSCGSSAFTYGLYRNIRSGAEPNLFSYHITKMFNGKEEFVWPMASKGTYCTDQTIAIRQFDEWWNAAPSGTFRLQQYLALTRGLFFKKTIGVWGKPKSLREHFGDSYDPDKNPDMHRILEFINHSSNCRPFIKTDS